MPKDVKVPLPAHLRFRPFKAIEARNAWRISAQLASHRLRAAVQGGALVRLGYGRYAVPAVANAPAMSPEVARLLEAAKPAPAFRVAVSGLDLLSGSLHYLPMRYPHLLLVERDGLADVRAALSDAGYLPVSPAGVAEVWRAEPKLPVVVLKPLRQFHGVPNDSQLAGPERAFLDLLYEVRHHDFPFPMSDLRRMWDEQPSAVRERIAHLGRYLRFRPFYRAGRRARVHDEFPVS